VLPLFISWEFAQNRLSRLQDSQTGKASIGEQLPAGVARFSLPDDGKGIKKSGHSNTVPERRLGKDSMHTLR